MRSSLPAVQILLTGLGFGESPRWHEGRLWFSNWGMQEVVAVDAAEWHGLEKMMDGLGTGQALMVEAPAPGAGWP